MKRTPLRSVGLSKASRLMRECDDLWKRLVKNRDGWRCRKCGSDYVVQGAHIFPKGRYRKLRFDLENGLALCRSCHMKQHHMTYGDQQEFFESIVGREHMDTLRQRQMLIRKTNLAATRIWLTLSVTKAGC